MFHNLNNTLSEAVFQNDDHEKLVTTSFTHLPVNETFLGACCEQAIFIFQDRIKFCPGAHILMGKIMHKQILKHLECHAA